jgi:O-antigen/teichoic acid export membrane protein
MRLGQSVAFHQKHAAIIINIILLLFEKSVMVGLVFFCEALISRVLGVSLYGKWIYSINTVILLSSLALIAGSEIVVPALVRHTRLRWNILSSAFLFRFIFSLIAVIITLLYSSFIIEDNDVQMMLNFMACAIIFNEPFSVIANFYQAQTKIGVVVAIRLTALLLRAILVFIALEYSFYLVVYSTKVIESLFVAISLSCVIIYAGGKWSWNKRVSIVIVKRGMAMWIPLILMLVYMRLDRFFIEYYLGFEHLAMYGVASQLLEQAVLVIGIVMQSVAPSMLYGRNITRIKTVCLGVFLIAFLMQILGFLLLKDIITLIFGLHYQPAAELAIMMLPALSFLAIDSVLMQLLYRDKKYMLIMFKWMILSIVGAVNYWLLLSVFHSDEISVVYVVNSCVMMVVTISIYINYADKGKSIKEVV